MNFDSIEAKARAGKPAVIAVCGADGDEVYEALGEAQKKGLARFLLVGDPGRCDALAKAHGVEPAGVISAEGDEDAAAKAVGAVVEGKAGVLMKGMVSSPVLLRAVVSEKRLFDEGRLLSHVLVAEGPGGRLVGVTDGGMCPTPDLGQKATIIRNAVALFQALGVKVPKVAALAANEKANPKIPGSQDAAELSRMAAEGAFPGCVVDGPIALDLALFPRSAEIKGYKGAVKGDADILLVHDISAGNHLGKAFVELAGRRGGGVIVGAKVPIILLSRADEAITKFTSILLALAGGVA